MKRLKITQLAILAIFLAGCNVGPKYTAPATPAPPAFKESAPEVYKSALPGTCSPRNRKTRNSRGSGGRFSRSRSSTSWKISSISTTKISPTTFKTSWRRGHRWAKRAPAISRRCRKPRVLEDRDGRLIEQRPTVGLGCGIVGRRGNRVFQYRAAARYFVGSGFMGTRAEHGSRIPECGAGQRGGSGNERLTEQASLAEYYFELRGQDALQDVARIVRWLPIGNTRSSPAHCSKRESRHQADVAVAEASLAGVEEAETGIATNRAIYEHAIATLVGKPASSFEMPVKLLSTPLPAIPVGVPSQLLQRRPDIAAAERTMSAANALIGIEKPPTIRRSR